MAYLDKYTGLYTDHYELTMAQGYFLNGRQNTPACFDYFFRKNPFDGGYVIFAGLADLLEVLANLRFEQEACAYLQENGFHHDFVSYLRDKFQFRATLHAPQEGEIVFPNEPVVRIEGNLIETQIVETLVLNILNFESLIATKACRIKQVAGDKTVIDFGLRRAQGLGGIHASKAAIIGGAESTSNVYSGFMFHIPTTGTQAHSWIQSYEDELTAFREFVRAFPEHCILLVDTYDTLKKGVPNAITVAKEMEKQGEKLFGIRLDSGDLAYLSKKARKMLDDAGLSYVKIVASNQIDEYVIRSLNEQNAPIDGFGVGTNLVTGRPNAALDGVYKLAACDGKPTLKISENTEKIILPGIKKIYRYYDKEGKFYGDGVMLDEENYIDQIYHPHEPDKQSIVSHYSSETLYQKVMENGQISIPLKTPQQAASYVKERINKLPEEHQRFENPHIYKVGISKRLLDMRSHLIKEKKSAIKS